MRSKETRYIKGDYIEIPDDRESKEFIEFCAEVGNVIRRHGTATIKAIKDDLESRDKVFIARWFFDAVAELRRIDAIHYNEHAPLPTKYHAGAKSERRETVTPSRRSLTGLFAKKAKNDYADLGL